MTDLCKQIQDGTLGFRLLEALEGFPASPVFRGKMKIMGKIVTAKPGMRLQRTENLQAFLDVVIHDKGIQVCESLVNTSGLLEVGYL